MTETLESAYRQHADELIRFATTTIGPDEAADVVADAMVNVIARGEEAVSSLDNVRAYLFRAVHHRVIDVERSRGRRRRREVVYERGRQRDASGPDTPVDARRLLAPLSPQQRAVVFLTYWSDLTPSDVAATLDIAEGSVRKQLARARARLREALDV